MAAFVDHGTPLSWKGRTQIALPSQARRQMLKILCETCRARELCITFGKRESGVLGSLPPRYLQWQAKDRYRGRDDLAEAVLGECGFFGNKYIVKTTELCSSDHEDEEQGKALERTQISAEEHTIASYKLEIGTDKSLDLPIDFATVAALLKRYGEAKSLLNGRRVHAQLSKHGYDREAFLGNRLMQMYSNCGSMEDAQAVFDKIADPDLYSWNILINSYAQNGSLEDAISVFERVPERDVVSWNAMIGAYARNGHGKKALELYHQMRAKTKQDKVTFICVLDACGSLGYLEKGQEIYAAIVDSGCEQDLIVGNALVNMYHKCKSIDDAKRVFSRMPQRNVVSWSTMIAACSWNGRCMEALQIFRQMLHEGIEPNKITFLCVLDACTTLAALEEIHTAIVDWGYEPDVVVSTALINMYGKCKNLDNARSVFDRMPQQNVISWNSMIVAFNQNGCPREAMELFSHLVAEGVKPEKATFISVIDACLSLGDQVKGQKIHAAIVNSGYEGDNVVGTALVHMYGKCQSLNCARNVFDRMHQRDVISWSAMIAAYTRCEHGKEALQLFREMQLEGVRPDKITLICVLDACSSLAALKESGETHAAIVSSGYDRDVVVGTALINMYGKCGSLYDARSVLVGLPVRDAVSWSATIAAHAQNGQGKEAFELFDQMLSDGVKPDAITFNSILTACSHTGRVNDGRHYFVSMSTDYGLAYTVEHYACMVDILGRAGHLDEAEGLINRMVPKNDAVVWLSLLSACKLHGDVERAAHAASHCFQLDPKNVVPYITLSNIYAAAGKWDDVMKVKEAMMSIGLEEAKA